MQFRNYTRLALTATMICGISTAIAADAPAIDPAAVDKAFETLKTYDWGQDRNLLAPIDAAVIATHGDVAARKVLETRLAEVLKTGASRDAKDFACRTLRVIGTAESVPALAALLSDKDLSHMARYALQSMPAPEASAALRDALPGVGGVLKVGVIGSLGAKRDAASVPALAALLGDADKVVASAAAGALGNIGTPEAAKALGGVVKTAPEGVKASVSDGLLICAERLLADGKKAEAMLVYKSLAGEDQPKHVRLAATRGLLAVAGKKD